MYKKCSQTHFVIDTNQCSVDLMYPVPLINWSSVQCTPMFLKKYADAASVQTSRKSRFKLEAYSLGAGGMGRIILEYSFHLPIFLEVCVCVWDTGVSGRQVCVGDVQILAIVSSWLLASWRLCLVSQHCWFGNKLIKNYFT